MLKTKKRSAALLLALCMLLTGTLAGCGKIVTSQNHGDPSQLSLPVDRERKAHLRIGTYNVKNCTNGDNTDRIAQQILDAQLDVVCVQEMDVNTDRSGSKDLVKLLADASGLPYYHFYQAMPFSGGGYGLAILSKYPLSGCKTIKLDTKSKEEPRIVAQAKLLTAAGPITISNTHLSYESQKSRAKQLAFLNEELSVGRNYLLMGDFNVEGFSEFEALAAFTGVNTEQTVYRTYRGDDSSFLSIDNLLYSNSIRADSVQMVDSDASDHNLLWAELTIVLVES